MFIAGIYVLNVYAKDIKDGTSDFAELTVYIDSIAIGAIGYLTDDYGNESYDTFHNDNARIKTAVELQDDGTYLIDNDGDSEWNYIFNPITGRLTIYEKEKTAKGLPLLLFLIIGMALALIAVILYLYKKDYF